MSSPHPISIPLLYNDYCAEEGGIYTEPSCNNAYKKHDITRIHCPAVSGHRF
jgi:hypothetical protein